MRFNENEEAVSPVIGVILMVAITVILAAVIAVFVFGMADDVQTSNVAAATAKVSGDDVVVTFQGGPDTVTKLNSTIYDATGSFTNDATMTNEVDDPEVGYSITFDDGMTTEAAVRIVVVATFDDGSSQVILDKNLV